MPPTLDGDQHLPSSSLETVPHVRRQMVVEGAPTLPLDAPLDAAG